MENKNKPNEQESLSPSVSEQGSSPDKACNQGSAGFETAGGSAAAEVSAPKIDVVLASASPRRKELLEKAGVRFRVHVSEVDETLDADTLAQPEEAAKKLAEKKAGAVVQEVLAQGYTGTAVIIGADTMVVYNDEIFGKPRSLSDATGMLRKLSGNAHEVITAVSVWMIMVPEGEKVSLGFRTFAEKSKVIFKELSDEEIAEYLRCGESFDKAGAYAAQGEGARLIERIEGDLDTVIGLPITKLLEEFPDLK